MSGSQQESQKRLSDLEAYVCTKSEEHPPHRLSLFRQRLANKTLEERYHNY